MIKGRVWAPTFRLLPVNMIRSSGRRVHKSSRETVTVYRPTRFLVRQKKTGLVGVPLTAKRSPFILRDDVPRTWRRILIGFVFRLFQNQILQLQNAITKLKIENETLKKQINTLEATVRRPEGKESCVRGQISLPSVSTRPSLWGGGRGLGKTGVLLGGGRIFHRSFFH